MPPVWPSSKVLLLSTGLEANRDVSGGERRGAGRETHVNVQLRLLQRIQPERDIELGRIAQGMSEWDEEGG